MSDNLFLDYISEELPVELGAWNALAAGRTAALVFEDEQKGEPAFSPDNFNFPRDRAECCIPYQVNKLDARRRKLNIIELLFIQHARIHHGIEYPPREMELKEEITTYDLTKTEEALLAGEGRWWNG